MWQRQPPRPSVADFGALRGGDALGLRCAEGGWLGGLLGTSDGRWTSQSDGTATLETGYVVESVWDGFWSFWEICLGFEVKLGRIFFFKVLKSGVRLETCVDGPDFFFWGFGGWGERCKF